MAAYPIAVVVGSLRRDSLNHKLANALVKMMPAEFELRFSAIGDLPHYNQDDEAQPAESVQRFRGEIAAARGVIFVSPEYNRSISGVLKNAIDQGSRPSGQSVWKGKPAGILGVSPGAIGTACGQQHLRNVLSVLDMPTLAQPDAFIQAKEGLFTADGSIGESSHKFIQGWVDLYVAWVRRNAV